MAASANTWKRIRAYFVEFSNTPRVVVMNPDSPNDYRIGRVTEINADATIKVTFESGPGDVTASFERHDLETIASGVNIKLPARD
jgi:hypothetical protein